MAHRLWRCTALAALALSLGSCGDEPTGLGARRGQLALAPRYAHVLANALVEVSAVRIVLTQPDGGATVLDTAIAFPAGSDSVALTLRVPLEGTSARFDLSLAMASPQGDTVFRSGPQPVTVSTNPLAPAVATPVLTYSGTGANASGVRFVAPPTSLGFDSTLTLVAEAFDGEGVAIANTPIGFEVIPAADSVRARFADPSVGQLQTRAVRGPVTVRASLLSGQSATHTINITPAASGLALVSGDAQTGTVGATLPAPLVARVVDRQLVIERREDALRRVQRRFAGVPAGVSLADELIADRRREVERDAR